MPKKFEDWTPPWVSKGEDFDEEQASRLIFNLETDKEKLGTQKAAVATERDTLSTQVTTITAERDQLQDKIDQAARAGETPEQKAERLEREIAALKANPAAGKPDADKATGNAALKLEVAMDADDNITAKQAKTLASFIQGSTKEELEESAKTFIESFGIPGAKKTAGDPEDDENGQDDSSLLRGRPRTARNPLDRDITSGGEKPVAELLGNVPRI